MTSPKLDSELPDIGRVWLVALATVLWLSGALAPLADADLPHHLAVGRWIVEHGIVPRSEPFAWTRLGAPYFAYSWGADVAYYVTWRVAGPVGLHVFHGFEVLAAAAAVWWCGRIGQWGSWATLLIAWAHAWVAIAIVSYLRPQALLFVLVPAAWALSALLVQRARTAPAITGLFIVGVVAANSHFLFGLTALPLLTVIADPPPNSVPDRTRWRRGLLGAVGLGAGWLATPYAFDWPAILRLNLTPNALLSMPSPLAELQPGFADSFADPALVAGLALSLLPWVAARLPIGPVARATYCALWLGGLVMFATVARGLVVWWFALFPLAAVVARAAVTGLTPLLRRAVLVTAIVWVSILAIRQADATRTRRPVASAAPTHTLPTPAAPTIDPLIEWLDEHANPGVRGRLLTVFDYGSYVEWRAPFLSPSVDGRTIFPDSAAAPDAYRVSLNGSIPLGPWQSAELAIVPLRYPVASVLDTASGWRRLTSTPAMPNGQPAAGLWARDDWWNAARK